MRRAPVPVRTLLALLVTVAASHAPICAGEASSSKGGSDVVVLTDENFDAQMAEGEWMIEIYAPWCVHCKALMPVWEQLATKMKPEGVKVSEHRISGSPGDDGEGKRRDQIRLGSATSGIFDCPRSSACPWETGSRELHEQL